MTGLSDPPAWSGPSDDPNDEQFGDVVEPTTLDDAGDYDAVLVGEPYDGAVIGRRGAREGPAAIRRELAGLKTHHFDAGPVDSLGDLGDVEVPDGDAASVASVQETVREVTERVYGAGAFPVFLGGDNSLTVPNAGPVQDRGSLGVISFDAHLDCREVRDDPTSGTPYRQLHDAGLDAFAVVGARHFETSTPYVGYARERGAEILPAADLPADPSLTAHRALAAMAPAEAIYVSVDVDVFDAAYAPAVSAPTPGGMTPREVFPMLTTIADDSRIVGFEVVETAPPLADGSLTAGVAARAVAHFVGGLRGDDGG